MILFLQSSSEVSVYGNGLVPFTTPRVKLRTPSNELKAMAASLDPREYFE